MLRSKLMPPAPGSCQSSQRLKSSVSRLFPFLALLFAPLVATAQAVPPNTASCLTPEATELAALANAYRQQNSLPAVPVSFSLASVAQWHVWDLRANAPNQGNCNLHSWSNARPAISSPAPIIRRLRIPTLPITPKSASSARFAKKQTRSAFPAMIYM